MKRSRVYPLAIGFLLVVMVVSSCAAPATTSVPTTAAQSCPTAAPQSCPTTVAQVMPKLSGWKQYAFSLGNVVITFDKGDKCSMKVINPLTSPELNYEIVTNDTTYQDYMVVYMTLDKGKTLADLQAWKTADSPPFAHGLGLDIVSPASDTGHSNWSLPVGQLYFSCYVQESGELRWIASVGPVDVPAKTP
jgi:hypothetical protein